MSSLGARRQARVIAADEDEDHSSPEAQQKSSASDDSGTNFPQCIPKFFADEFKADIVVA